MFATDSSQRAVCGKPIGWRQVFDPSPYIIQFLVTIGLIAFRMHGVSTPAPVRAKRPLWLSASQTRLDLPEKFFG